MPSPENAGLLSKRPPLQALTGVRFLAAFYVVLFHSLPWLRNKYQVPETLQIFLGNGYLAVSLFFILSGFILAYTYDGQIQGTRNLFRFWQARFARIYPVYFLSLLLCIWFERNLGVSTRIAVLAMIQAWNPLKPSLIGAWNYPAWTLSVEAFFYLCFPFLLPWLARRSNRASFWLIALLLLTCVFLHVPMQGLGNIEQSSLLVKSVPLPLLRIPEFLLGMVIGLKYLREAPAKPTLPNYKANLAVLTILILLCLPLGLWVSLVAIPFAALVFELAVGDSILAKFLSTRTMVLLGGASYATYLLQYPIRSWTRVLFSQFPEKIAGFGTPLTPLILVVVSILVFRYWEEPWRRTLRSWFVGAKPPRSKLPSSDLAKQSKD